MFGWFSPTCPLQNPREKTWIEMRMRWLAEEFGIDRMRAAEVLLPNETHFPDPYHGTAENVESLKVRLCGLLRIDPERITLKLHSDEEMPGAVGTYEPRDDGGATIRIANSQLADLESLLATLSHELAHHLLLGEGRLTTEQKDHESVTDLLPVFFGLGLFSANATIRETMETSVGWHYWSISRQGYLPSRMYGYALALFAWVRGETNPQWAGRLRLDARDVLKKGLKYLETTNDSLFRPDSVDRKPEPASMADLISDLGNPFPGRRIAALWALKERGDDAKSAAEAVATVVDDDEISVRSEAVATLPVIGADAQMVVETIVKALDDPAVEVRILSAAALSQYTDRGDVAIGELTGLLSDQSLAVVGAAAKALSRFGSQARDSAESFIKPLRTALIECEHDLADTLLLSLAEIHPEPDEFLRIQFQHDDEELSRRSRETLAELFRDEPAEAE